MRLFCAIEIPGGIKAGIRALTDCLRPLAKLSWSPVENLHVTTKFIGEWPDARIDEVGRALAGVPPAGARPAGAVEIHLRGLDWFPNERNPRVLFAGIEAGAALGALADSTNRSLAALGVPAEEPEFHPHLTLARRRDPVPIDRLRKEVAENRATELGSFRAESFFLYLSKAGKYTKLQEYPLI